MEFPPHYDVRLAITLWAKASFDILHPVPGLNDARSVVLPDLLALRCSRCRRVPNVEARNSLPQQWTPTVEGDPRSGTQTRELVPRLLAASAAAVCSADATTHASDAATLESRPAGATAAASRPSSAAATGSASVPLLSRDMELIYGLPPPKLKLAGAALSAAGAALAPSCDGSSPSAEPATLPYPAAGALPSQAHKRRMCDCGMSQGGRCPRSRRSRHYGPLNVSQVSLNDNPWPHQLLATFTTSFTLVYVYCSASMKVCVDQVLRQDHLIGRSVISKKNRSSFKVTLRFNRDTIACVACITHMVREQAEARLVP